MIPAEGTIERCPHSVYAPNGDAWGCQFCRPPEAEAGGKIPILPKCGSPLSSEELHANSHQEGHCPKCKSPIHYVVGPGKWQCCDCDEIFRAPRNRGEVEGE